LQAGNITEKGEQEATDSIRSNFNNGQPDDAAIPGIRKYLQQILTLNMMAIRSKTEASEEATENALTYLVTIVLVIIAVGFTFAVNFPSLLTGPINKLTEAIREISQKNYRHRVHVASRDEFGELAKSFNEMAERLEYFESSNLNKILFEKSRAEAVINSLKDASIGIDKNDMLLFANDQALQLLGLSARDIAGVKASDIAKRNDLFQHLLQEKNTTPFKVVLDNRENYFLKETMELGDAADSSRVIVLKNITSFKELDVAKTNFIATVSHELKTPLAASDFSIRLLEDERVGALSHEQKELVHSLKADNQRMLRILSELLNLSQVEAGRLQLHIQSIDLHPVVENSLLTVASTAKEKSIRLEKTLQEGLPLVNVDADKIEWVVNNFLTNAIRYAPENSVIEIRVFQQETKVCVTVTDHGQGIDEPYLGRIFERYFQVPGRSDKNGSGIGLAICKEFIEAMGGRIWVKSALGQGSTFGFDLPAGVV
jgi:signal transduction histidine kinase